MTTRHMAAVATAALLLSFPASAQSTSDLLQKGIHAQEATGDLDVAIAIFRQVASKTDAANNGLAAQAQYQLVLCMLQKGDRPAASKELAALEHNFPLQNILIANARKLIPGTAALLPVPWGNSESAQLNIKREGVATGEYLYYSADAWDNTVTKNMHDYEAARNPQIIQAVVLQWQLRTKNSTRNIRVAADKDTMHPVEPPHLHSDDDLGDPLAAPFSGPATDVEQSVFLMRRLPLAVGYKTTLPVTSNQYAPSQLELTVSGIETIQTRAGKFNAYKVSFAGVGQTFWIGVEGSRPLVKFRSGSVEAELVKMWTTAPESLLGSLSEVARAAGGKTGIRTAGPGDLVDAFLELPNSGSLSVNIHKIYTPAAEIPQALERALAEKTSQRHLNPANDYKVRDGSLQTRLIGGQQALSCLLDYRTGPLTVTDNNLVQMRTLYIVWIGSENELVELSRDMDRPSVAVFRWQFDPIVNAVRLP